MKPLLPWEDIGTTYSECMSVALVTQHAKRMGRIILSSVSYHIFPYYLTNDTIVGEKKFTERNKMCVFVFSTTLVETFLIVRRNEWAIILNVLGLHVKYPLFLSDFNETCILGTDFRKILKHQISWKSLKWEPSFSMRTDSRTWRS